MFRVTDNVIDAVWEEISEDEYKAEVEKQSKVRKPWTRKQVFSFCYDFAFYSILAFDTGWIMYRAFMRLILYGWSEL